MTTRPSQRPSLLRRTVPVPCFRCFAKVSSPLQGSRSGNRPRSQRHASAYLRWCACTETLKQLSKLFDVSINTLLGTPRQLICQCCGMPLDDETLSKEPDGEFNEDYCKWCYSDGKFTYESKEQLIDFCVEHMANENWPAEKVRAHMESLVPTLKHWK